MKKHQKIANSVELSKSNASIFIFILSMLTPGLLFADEGNIKWSNFYDLGGGFNEAQALVTQGNRVYVAGFGYAAGPEFQQEFLVRSYNSKTGALAWQDTYNNTGFNNQAFAIASANNKIFAAGVSETNDNKGEFLVRAYKSKTGELLWDEEFDAGGGFNNANGIVADRNMAFAVGSGTGEDSMSLWLVRAYNSKTGIVVWSDQYNTGIEGGATAVTIEGDKVFVGGLSFSHNSEGLFVVRAYDSRTGALLWDDEYDNEGKGSLGVNAITVKGGRVYAVGTVSGSGGDELFVIRVYDTATGDLIWEDQSIGSTLVDAPLSVYAGTNRVYAAGFIFPDSGPVVFLVRAYDSRTGAMVWEDEYDQGVDNDSCTSAYAVSGQGNSVYVAGKIATGEYSEDCASDFLVRSYDSATGELFWQNQFSDGGEENLFSTIVAKGSRIYAAGMVETDKEIKKFAVRTYQER